MILSGAVEGSVDEAVLRRLVIEAGAELRPVYGKQGKQYLRDKIYGYNQAAHFWPWVVLVDLDDGADCAPPLRQCWLPSPASQMCFRIAVREVEAWVLADRERIANFLAVPVSHIPLLPEREGDPKRTMVELARRSRRREVREDMVPRSGSGRKIGPAYTSRLIEFVTDSKTGWRPEVAANCADSLKRCLRRLKELVGPNR